MATSWLCSKCRHYLGLQEQSEQESLCTVCLNTWTSQDALRSELEQKSAIYGGLASNRWAQSLNHSPKISISGEIRVRYQHFVTDQSTPASVFLSDLKQQLQQQLQEILESKETQETVGLKSQEEQGYLSMHLLCVPSKQMKGSAADKTPKKRKRQRNRPFVTQGGDPRATLEQKLQAEGYTWQTISQVESLPKPEKLSDNPLPIEFHVAIFRRPIYLYGYYTKSRRDVSQTPFVVGRLGYIKAKQSLQRKSPIWHVQIPCFRTRRHGRAHVAPAAHQGTALLLANY